MIAQNDHRITDLPRRGPAIAAMFMAALLFALMTLTTKMLGQPRWTTPLPPAQVTFARFFFGAVVMLPLLAFPRANLLGTDRRGLLVRGLAGGLAVYAYYMAIRHTTLTNAVLLNFTSVVFAPMCAAIWLGERVHRRAGMGIVLACLGILLVTQPHPGALRSGDLYGLASGVLAGFALTAIRRLRRQETASSVFFYFSLVGMPIALIGMLAGPVVVPDARGWWLLAAMSACSVAAQILMTYGYRYVQTAEGVLMTLSQIVYSAIAGAMVFGEPLKVATAVGGALILVSGVAASTASRR